MLIQIIINTKKLEIKITSHIFQLSKNNCFMNCKLAQRVSECRISNNCVNKLCYLLNQNYFLRGYMFTWYHSLFWCFQKQNKLSLQRFLYVFLCFLTFCPNHQTWGIWNQFVSVRCFKFSSSGSSPSELFLGKAVLKIIIKLT